MPTEEDKPLMSYTLHTRHDVVTELTKKYYQGDVVPPSTKSQILRAQKFSVMYYYMMNSLFFLYALFIPLHTPDPYYGGLNPRTMKHTEAALIIVGIVLVLCLIRFIVMSWQAEFYQFGFLLATLEIALTIYTMVNWSTGIPVLLMIFLANSLNLCVSQFYWKHHFASTIQNLQDLVPPAASHAKDSTSVEIFPGFNAMYVEWSKLWGFKKHKTLPDLYDERCGVFCGKEQMSHAKAMHSAYMQAVDGPRSKWATWKHAAHELWELNFMGLMDGLLNTFVSNLTYAFAGLWLGKAMFVNWYHGGLAIVFAVIAFASFFVSVWRTTGWLEEALGVAVAEKEWLAHDVVRHKAEREEMIFDTLDLMGSENSPLSSKVKPGSPVATQTMQTPGAEIASLEFMTKGRLNLVFMWLCTASIAGFIGESYLARLYWNLSIQTRYMVEALTPYDFKLFPHAKWEVIRWGTMQKMAQTFALVVMSAIFFGSYFYNSMPVPLMAFISASAFVQSVLKLMEALEFAFTILGSSGKNTQRHKWVSEWIIMNAVLFVLTNVTIWLYLLPMMKGWDLPVGRCRADFNKWLFPAVCGQL